MIQIMRAEDADLNPIVPAHGQPAYGLTSHTLKIGDGVTTWENLPKVGEALQVADVPAGADLDNYVNPGWYKCGLSATVQTLANSPTSDAFFLEVGQHAGVYQRLVEFLSNSPRIFFRNYYDGDNPPWGGWHREYTTADPPSLSDVSGVLPVSKGGTSATNARDARWTLEVPTSRPDVTTHPDQIEESGFYLVSEQEGIPHAYSQMIVAHGGGDTIAQIDIPYDPAHGFPKIRFGNPPVVGGVGTYHGWYDLYTSQAPIPVSSGGTGASDPATARIRLSVPINTTEYTKPEDELLESGFYRVAAQGGVIYEHANVIVSRQEDTIAQISIPYDPGWGNPKIRYGNPPSVGGSGRWYGWYDILTSMKPVSVAEGGTGAASAADALNNLGALPRSWVEQFTPWHGNSGNSPITVPNGLTYTYLLIMGNTRSDGELPTTILLPSSAYGRFQLTSNHGFLPFNISASGSNVIISPDNSEYGGALTYVFGILYHG